MRVNLRNIRIKYSDLIDAVAVGLEIIIILAEKQIGGGARVRRNHVRRDDRGRVVPAEAARQLPGLKISAEVQKEAARSVVWTCQNADKDVAIGTNQRGSRAHAGNNGIDTRRTGISQRGTILCSQSRAVQAEQIRTGD